MKRRNRKKKTKESKNKKRRGKKETNTCQLGTNIRATMEITGIIINGVLYK